MHSVPGPKCTVSSASSRQKQPSFSKPKKATNNKTDQSGTSEPEQAIFYYIKKYFDDTINRAQLYNSTGDCVVVDIWVPSIKVAIEYDGKRWHRKKEKQDNYKNKVLNEQGIYVIRVRDCGLPKLDPFNGNTYFHGKAPDGQYITEIISDIIRELNCFIPEGKRPDLENFTLSYEGYLDQRPNIEALLFKLPKEKNFTQHSCFQYWDNNKNGNLDPRNLEFGSNAFAWFKCPRGDYIVRIIQNLANMDDYCLEHHTVREYCIYDICPFLPNDSYLAHGRDCGKSCQYVEFRFKSMIKEYLSKGLEKTKLDICTEQALKYYP